MIDSPSEKKSTAGADGRDTGAECFSSTETLALPRATEVGMKGIDAFFSTFSSRMNEWDGSRTSRRCVSPSESSSASSTVAVLTDALGAALKTKPGPRPPPSTLSAVGAIGALFLGAGSIDSRPEAPAPDSSRAFFVGGRSSVSEVRSSSLDKLGSPIAIFFGAFLVLGGGKASPEDALEEEAELAGGGSANVDFLAGAGSLEVMDALDVVVETCGVVSPSLALSLSLPYPSTPSMMMWGGRRGGSAVSERGSSKTRCRSVDAPRGSLHLLHPPPLLTVLSLGGAPALFDHGDLLAAPAPCSALLVHRHVSLTAQTGCNKAHPRRE